MSKQSTNHLLMIEPASFYANPETMATNVYQLEDDTSHDDTFDLALAEFRFFRDKLIEYGVCITTVRGYDDCPDMVFPNSISTHRDSEGMKDGRMVIYPMLNKNRQDERSEEVLEMLRQSYADVHDWSHYQDGDTPRALEATAAIVSDKVNKVAYSGVSARSDKELAQKWCDFMGYDLVQFNTHSHHTGMPVYHTDVIMWIGSTLAGVCSENIGMDDRARVLDSLRKTHEVVEFTEDQLTSFCGNALEVIGADGAKFLVMSEAAFKALTDAQVKVIRKHFADIIHAPLYALEKYGGGSARCCLMELF